MHQLEKIWKSKWLIAAVVSGAVGGAVSAWVMHIIDEMNGDKLESLHSQTPNMLPKPANDALPQGDRSKADQRLAQFEEKSTPAVAEAVYQRSQIALEEVRYQDAYKHAQRAVWLVPENILYLANAGDLAWELSDYIAAKDYREQALNNALKIYDEDHPNVAIHYSNLGSAWQALGEYQKAIGYYEQALAGERNNLGAVWQALGEYEKAISYFGQALPVFERKLGPEHPHTKSVRARLTAARAGLKKADAAGQRQNP